MRAALANGSASVKRGLGGTTVGRRDEALCDELKEVAGRLGVRVREETLLREVGYRVRSGSCRVRGEEVIFLDRGASPEERLQVLADRLAVRDVDEVYLSPALRRLLEQRRGARV